jgi:hypothetical protein
MLVVSSFWSYKTQFQLFCMNKVILLAQQLMHIHKIFYIKTFKITPKYFDPKIYNPPTYSIGRHVFLSGNLSVLSGGTVILLTLVTINIIYIISRC